MELQRPDPDEILKSMKEESHKKYRGKLKIFFGYAAGVGKTYAMLKSAHQRKKQGADVVIGYLEPHSRPETMELSLGLETVPVRTVPYNKMLLREMDLSAVLERKPQLALVDEFAHTNAHGSRHAKRYQDVEELLEAGIDVYTTVNVQHIESLCDIVASITGILVRERIPDRMLDLADEVTLVDIEPLELIKRLEDGKIYRAGQAKQALGHFFTEEKLTALREIALRRCADRVNLMSERAKRENGSEYFTEEKIVVGLSSSPSNPKIIRAAARMAQAFHGELTAIYVETSGSRSISRENQKRLKENIHLAEQLGAKIETITGDDISFLLAEYARVSGVSKIVIGRSNTKRRFFYGSSFADRLTVLAPNVDIYIIPDRDAVSWKGSFQKKKYEPPAWRNVVIALVILACSTVLGFLFDWLGFSEANIITVYIFGAMICGVTASSRLCSLCLSILNVLVFNYCFTEPRLSLKTYHTGYPVTFLITFLAAFISGSLTLKLKKQARDLARVAYRTKVLLDTSQLLQKERDIQGIGRLAANQLVMLLSRDVVFYQARDSRLLEPVLFPAAKGASSKSVSGAAMKENTDRYTEESEKAVADWVFRNNKRAGAATDTLGDSACYYLAVRGSEAVYGVIGIGMNPGEGLEAFENNLVFSVLSETAAAMERETLRQKEESARNVGRVLTHFAVTKEMLE